jgi:hypothetical protein
MPTAAGAVSVGMMLLTPGVAAARGFTGRAATEQQAQARRDRQRDRALVLQVQTARRVRRSGVAVLVPHQREAAPKAAVTAAPLAARAAALVVGLPRPRLQALAGRAVQAPALPLPLYCLAGLLEAARATLTHQQRQPS